MMPGTVSGDGGQALWGTGKIEPPIQRKIAPMIQQKIDPNTEAWDPWSKTRQRSPRPTAAQGVDLSFTNSTCAGMRVDACNMMEDFCSTAKAGNLRGGDKNDICSTVQTYCTAQKKYSDHLHLDMTAEFCVNFEASDSACAIGRQVCSSHPQAADVNFCKQLNTLCDP